MVVGQPVIVVSQPVIVASDPQPRGFCFRVNHVLRKRAKFFGPHTPIAGANLMNAARSSVPVSICNFFEGDADARHATASDD
jgi:hypothetical protein